MSVNNDRNGSGLLDSASHWQAPGSAANNQDVFLLVEPGDPPQDPPPPLGVELTCYRLLNVTTVIIWVVPKAILSYKNRSAEATTVDLFAALFGVMLYLVGLYEQTPGNNWEWFFHVDLAPAFGHPARHFVGVVNWALSFLVNVPLFFFLLFFLCIYWLVLFVAMSLPTSYLSYPVVTIICVGPTFIYFVIYWFVLP